MNDYELTRLRELLTQLQDHLVNPDDYGIDWRIQVALMVRNRLATYQEGLEAQERDDTDN